ncbi:MAG: TerB family tellurite resistance protein [Betaproteobacteria bacterium]|nr:TerB family tellurite resistance protein [Betaproteobacteria bacterium]
MKTYAPNSPEAVARVLAMAIVSDGELDRREIHVLEDMDAYSAIGLTRNEFLKVAKDFCGDLARLDAPSISLLAKDIFDPVVGAVTDRAMRDRAARLLVAVVGADNHHAPQERLLLSSILAAWSVDPDTLVGESSKK